MSFIKYLPLLLLSFTTLISTAAIPSKHELHWVHQSGALRGGQAGAGFSLRGIGRMTAKNAQFERLKIEIGNAAMNPLKGSVGYYHAELQSKPPRLVINFSQTLNSRFENREILKIIKGSKIIKKSDLFFDPVGQNLTLHLELYRPASVRAFSTNGGGKKRAQLVFDIKEYKK